MTGTGRIIGGAEAASRGARSPFATRTFFTLSEGETVELGRTIGRGLKGGEIVVLRGALGAGKTVFTRGLAEGLGVDPDEVSSPSFTLVQEYRGGRAPLFHVDLYRLDVAEEELPTLGIEDILTAGGVVVVEWGEKLPPFLRRGALTVTFHEVGEDSRRVEIANEAKAERRPAGDA